MPEVDPLRARIQLATGSAPGDLRQFATAIRAAEGQLATASGSVAQLSRNITAFSAEIIGAFRATQVLSSRTSALGGAATATRGSMLGLTAAVAGTGTALIGTALTIAEATREAAKFEVQVAELAKLVGEDVAAPLAESISDLGNELPVARDQLFNVAEAAARLGVRGVENITTFTRVVAEIGVATDLSAEVAATAMARLAKITQTPISEIRNLASAFNEASNTMAVSFSEVVDAAQRAAPGLSAIGASQPEIAALAGSTAELSASAERAGTRLNRLAAALADPRQAEDFAAALSLASDGAEVTAQSFREMVAESPAETILELAEVMRGGGQAADQLAGTLQQTSLKVLRALSQNLDEARASLTRLNTAFREGTSIGEEYNRFASTAQAESQRLSNRITDLQRRVGEDFLPVWKDLLETTADIVQVFNELFQAPLEEFFPEEEAERFRKLIEDATGATDEFRQMARPGGDRFGQVASRGFRDAQAAATELEKTIALLGSRLDSAIRPEFFRRVDQFLRANRDSKATVSEFIAVINQLARDMQAAADDALPPLTEALNQLRENTETSKQEVDSFVASMTSIRGRVPTGQLDAFDQRLVGLIGDFNDGELSMEGLAAGLQTLAEAFGVARTEAGLTADELDRLIEKFTRGEPEVRGFMDAFRAFGREVAATEQTRRLVDQMLQLERALGEVDTELVDAGEAGRRAFESFSDELDQVFEASKAVALAQGDVVRALESVQRAGRSSFEVVQEMLRILARTDTSLAELEELDPGLADGLKEAAKQAGLTREEIEALLAALKRTGEEGARGIEGFIEGFADAEAAVDAINTALAETTDLMEGLGVISSKTADTIQSVLGPAIEGASIGAQVGGPIGAAVGGGIGLVSGIVGMGPGPAQQLLNELPLIIRLLGDAADRLDEIAISLGEVEVEKFRELRDTLNEVTIGDELEPSEIRKITQRMEELGLSMADLQEVARDLGLPIDEAVKRLVTGKGDADLAAAQLRALGEALGLLPDAADAAQRAFLEFADTLRGQLSLIRDEFEILDVEAPVDQLRRMGEVLADLFQITGAAPPAFVSEIRNLLGREGGLSDQDVGRLEQAIEALFLAIVEGDLAPGILGDLDRQEVIDLLKEMEGLLDEVSDNTEGDAEAAATQGFQRQNRITQVQFERAFAADLTRNSLLTDIAEFTRLTAEGVTGMDLDEVEVAGDTVVFGDETLAVLADQLAVQTDIFSVLDTRLPALGDMGEAGGGPREVFLSVNAPISVDGTESPREVARQVADGLSVELSRSLSEKLGIEVRSSDSRRGRPPTRSF